LENINENTDSLKADYKNWIGFEKTYYTCSYIFLFVIFAILFWDYFYYSQFQDNMARSFACFLLGALVIIGPAHYIHDYIRNRIWVAKLTLYFKNREKIQDTLEIKLDNTLLIMLKSSLFIVGCFIFVQALAAIITLLWIKYVKNDKIIFDVVQADFLALFLLVIYSSSSSIKKSKAVNLFYGYKPDIILFVLFTIMLPYTYFLYGMKSYSGETTFKIKFKTSTIEASRSLESIQLYKILDKYHAQNYKSKTIHIRTISFDKADGEQDIRIWTTHVNTTRQNAYIIPNPC